MGSSSRNTSKRLSRIAASDARAACPPDSVAVGASSERLREPEVGAHRADAGVEVGAAEREVAVERARVASSAPGLRSASAAAAALELGVRRRHAGAAAEERRAASRRGGRSGSWGR